MLTDNANVWNDLRVDAFDDNPNAVNELQSTVQNILTQLVSLLDVKEWAASIGIELPLDSTRTWRARSRWQPPSWRNPRATRD